MMTSQLTRNRATTTARVPALATCGRRDNGTMPTRGASITATSDYGSDLDIDVRSIASLSDYGSEFDPDDIDLSAAVGEEKSVYSSIEFKQGERNSIIDHEDTPMAVFVRAGLYTAKRRTAGNRQAARAIQSSPVRETMEFEYLSRPRQVWSVPREEPPEVPSKPINTFSSASSESIPVADQPITPAEHDIRSPIERFRMKPKKPLSVTDLVSPAWCELQYLYALSKFGRKPRTKAMRTGSRIHQTLEEQVHTIVPVQVKSKEDRFGLRIWNMIRGLRCLRETGLTRELEVWGVIQGEVVNGVIDELSYTCPDREFEEQLELSKAEEAGGTLPLGQMKIEQAFSNAAYDDQNDSGWLGSLEADRQVYIVDVKTRSVRSPPKGASLRPTWMQLMLYRRLLESLSLNTVDAEAIFERYNLCSLEPFTEVFISEIGGLGDASEDSDDDYNGSGANSQANEVLQHPNLLSLWSLMIMELQHTLPSASISSILRAEFRFAKTGDVIGNELAVYDGIVIESYISDVMKLWKGKREAKGVDIEDAFKCRMCDFVDQCAWRKTKIEEATEKHRRRNKARGKDKV